MSALPSAADRQLARLRDAAALRQRSSQARHTAIAALTDDLRAAARAAPPAQRGRSGESGRIERPLSGNTSKEVI